MGASIDTNRGIKVEALNQELQGSKINKRESQSIFNIINAGKAKMTKIASGDPHTCVTTKVSSDL